MKPICAIRYHIFYEFLIKIYYKPLNYNGVYLKEYLSSENIHSKSIRLL